MHIILAGWEALVDYLILRRIISLTIAFFLSGAIAQFMSQGAVMKYFGPNSDKRLSYLVASVSGAILAVCSCSVLPMFAGIRKKRCGDRTCNHISFLGTCPEHSRHHLHIQPHRSGYRVCKSVQCSDSFHCYRLSDVPVLQ